MDRWAICTIENNRIYYLKEVVGHRQCIWTASLAHAIKLESKGLAEYFATTRRVRKYHIREV